MPELPELEVIRDVLNRFILGQTITSTEVIPPSGPIVVCDLTGEGFAPGLTGTCFESYPGGPAAV
jgi:formamidopyrimidine-DNA glycosylase